VLVGRATGRRRRYRLVKERHRKVREIEQPRINAIAVLEVPKNPLRRLLGDRPGRVLPTMTEMTVMHFSSQQSSVRRSLQADCWLGLSVGERSTVAVVGVTPGLRDADLAAQVLDRA